MRKHGRQSGSGSICETSSARSAKIDYGFCCASTSCGRGAPELSLVNVSSV